MGEGTEALAPLADRLRTLGVPHLAGEPLRRHTTFGIGGPAGLFVEPDTTAALAAALDALREAGVPWFVVGLGSNLLVSDRGYPGVVLSLLRAGRELAVRGDRLEAGAGVPLAKAAHAAQAAGLSGLEYAISIPGSVGGAVAMNAGAHGAATADVLEAVTLWSPEDGVVELAADALGFAYRYSRVHERPWVVLAARFRLVPADPGRVLALMRRHMAYRKATQPVGERNAGSMFKNPPEGRAGALIEAVGAKGWTEGGAHVSRLHANFIINTGDATARDVLTLMRRVRRAVMERFGAVLRPEVRWVGPPEGEAGTSWETLWLREDSG
ncbi:MAG: UDP-N-acetylmuramate dehydrogenase [Actinomycetia bacterium]|nr:UDP-N-acetylmuramate dehydrogenase [Actinomycetes bacterium]